MSRHVRRHQQVGGRHGVTLRTKKSKTITRTHCNNWQKHRRTGTNGSMLLDHPRMMTLHDHPSMMMTTTTRSLDHRWYQVLFRHETQQHVHVSVNGSADMNNYIAPVISYDKCRKASGCEDRKGHFLYEYMDCLKGLDNTFLHRKRPSVD